MTDKLVVHRFRGIREGVLDDLNKINLLIGPNNSGKTAILEMIYLGGLSGRYCNLILEDASPEFSVFDATTTTTQDFLGYEPLPRLRLRHGQKELWEDSPATQTLEGGMEITLRDSIEGFSLYHFRLGSPLDAPGLNNVQVFLKEDLKNVVMFTLRQRRDIPSDMIPPLFEEQGIRSEGTNWHFLWQPELVYKWDRNRSAIEHLAIWADTGYLSGNSHVLFFDFHIANSHFNNEFAKLLFRKAEEKIAKSLGRVFPPLENATIDIFDAPDGQEGKTGYIRFSGKEPIAVDHFGDGTRHSFKVLASLIALAETADEQHPGLFLWEDPELFMNPATLWALVNEVIEIIKNKPIQAFISTQSLDVLAWIGQMLSKDNSMAEYVNAHSLILQPDGKLKDMLFHGTEIIKWLESGFDLRNTEMVMIDKSPISWRLKPSDEEEILW